MMEMVARYLFVICLLCDGGFGSSFNVINSAVKDCQGTDCRFVCEFDNIKLSPGQGDIRSGKCIGVYCSEEYELTVDTCPKEEGAQCVYGHDFSRPFPDCCNAVCRSVTHGEDHNHDHDHHS